MATNNRKKIEAKCPVCLVSYRVAEEMIGRKARCAKCQAKFRIAALPKVQPTPPTEDDICTWLNDGLEDFEFPKRAKVISAALPDADAHPEDPDLSDTAQLSDSSCTGESVPKNRLPSTDKNDVLGSKLSA